MMPNAKPQENPDEAISRIQDVVRKNDSGIIVIPEKSTLDAVSAATSLYMALSKMGKNISLVASQVPKYDLAGVDKIKTKLSTGGDNLVVSFPYEEGAIDKVDYNIQNERFNLVIMPREGHNKLEPKDVKFDYIGGSIDFIITIDAPNLNSLGEIYTKNEQQFGSATIINIDRHLINSSYGMINLVVKQSSSTSQLVLSLIKKLKAELDKDMATNLYAGVASATNNFTAYSVNADTFEAIAELMRAGAVKKNISMNQSQNNSFGSRGFGAQPQMMRPQFGGNSFGSPVNQPSFGGFPQQNNPNMNMGFPMQSQSSNQVQRPNQNIAKSQSFPNQDAPKRNEIQSRSLGSVEKVQGGQEGNEEDASSENELKPKIFDSNKGIM